MNKVTRTYPGFCTTCNGTGQLMDDPNSTNLYRICPVCNGSKVIPITEVEEYQDNFDIDPKFKQIIIPSRLHMEDMSGHTLSIDEMRKLHKSIKEDEENAWKIPSLLKLRRKHRGLTLRAVSSKTGLSPSTIMRIENGNQCLADNYNALLRFWKQYDEKNNNGKG